MPTRCAPVGKVLTRGISRQSFGDLAERVVQLHYCTTFRQPCELFAPPTGGQLDFFDENVRFNQSTGEHRCAALARYLKLHNPHVDELAIDGMCRASHPKPLSVKVPDIISHALFREFYEIKPNSDSGRRDGAEKIALFNTLCHPLVANLPYRPGTQYRPDFVAPIAIGSALGQPFRIGIHVFWAVEGLLLWELCPVTDRPEEEKCTALMRASAVAALVLHRTAPQLVASRFDRLVGLAGSPLRASVGRDAVNDPRDVRYVQLLLNDARGRDGAPLIAEDGDHGPRTGTAITEFQAAVTGIPDGRVDPGGPAIAALEGGHLRAMFGATEAAVAAHPLPEVLEDTIYHDTDEESDDVDDLGFPISQQQMLDALDDEMAGYLGLLY